MKKILLILMLLCATSVYAQGVKQNTSAKAISEAKVGDVLERRGNIETIKADEKGTLQSKVYTTPHWDLLGEPIVKYDEVTGKIQTQNRYVIFKPDEGVKSLQVDRIVSDTSIKETYTLRDDKISKLSWTVTRGALGVTFGKGELTFLGFLGQPVLTTPAPTAWGANKDTVKIDVTFKYDILTYTVDLAKAVFPVTIDPTTTITGSVDQIGHARSTPNATYLTVRDGVGAVTGNTFNVGQYLSDGNYLVYRGFLCFPGISTMTSAQACTLYACVQYDQSGTNFGVYIVGGRAWKSTLTSADYRNFNGWVTSGTYNGTILNDTWNTSSIVGDDTWQTIVFNSSGLDSLELASGDSLWIAGISSTDWEAVAPSDISYVNFYGAVTSPPYISFTYEADGGGAPAIKPSTHFRNKDGVPIRLNKDGVPVKLWGR